MPDIEEGSDPTAAEDYVPMSMGDSLVEQDIHNDSPEGEPGRTKDAKPVEGSD